MSKNEDKSVSEMVQDYLDAGGVVKVVPAKPAQGILKSGVVGTMSKK